MIEQSINKQPLAKRRRIKVSSKPFSCHNCNKKSSKNKPNFLKASLNNLNVYFCTKLCSKGFDVEFLDCTACKNTVSFIKNSITCTECNHRVHKTCTDLFTDNRYT